MLYLKKQDLFSIFSFLVEISKKQIETFIDCSIYKILRQPDKILLYLEVWILALVAQLDRALPSGGRGREFESRRVHHYFYFLGNEPCFKNLFKLFLL